MRARVLAHVLVMLLLGSELVHNVFGELSALNRNTAPGRAVKERCLCCAA
jgi:hypothetical protein